MTDITIIMPLWKRERYITKALDSIFSQNTHYSYKIVIADEHSTDRTLDIIATYENRYPGIITILKSKKSKALQKNVLRVYEMLDTPYFCVLNPDDYWISDRHIENALNFLKSNEDFTIYSSGIRTISKDGKGEVVKFSKVAVDSDFSDYLSRRAVIAYTQTCVYRNVVFSEGIPARILEMKSDTKEKMFRGDSFRNFLHIRKGRAHYEPQIEGCYRLTDSEGFQETDAFEQFLNNAELLVDLWRFDYCKYYELLLWSRKIYKKALKEWRAIDNNPSILKKKKITYYKALMRLDKIYRSKIIRLRWCMWKESIQKRCSQYRLKLKRSLNERIQWSRINKSIRGAKYVHLMHDDKFAKPFVDFLRRNFPIKEHVVICDSFAQFPFDEDECAFKVSDCFKRIKFGSANIKKIICHSLFVRGAVNYFFEHPKLLREKVYWTIYGGDLYNAPRDEKNDFVRKNFHGYINKIDMEYALSKYGMKGQFFHCSSMFPTLKLEVPKAKAHDGVRVQINNSCDGSTLEMLDILSKFKDENVVITTVLSYGDMKFRDAIIEKGRSIFGKKFEFLDRYLSSKEYAIWQNSNDVLVLNQRRQQGLGNTLFALKSGIKVYLRSDVSTFKYISENGGCVFDTLAISGMLWQSFVEYLISDRTRSVNFVMDNYKEKRMTEEWNNVFLYLN